MPTPTFPRRLLLWTVASLGWALTVALLAALVITRQTPAAEPTRILYGGDAACPVIRLVSFPTIAAAQASPAFLASPCGALTRRAVFLPGQQEPLGLDLAPTAQHGPSSPQFSL